jgi:drug/metabolite transporter superfamily protein YnfA
VSTLLIVVGGFLLGGAYSVWQQSKGEGRARRGQILAVALAVCAVLAVVGGILRLV